MALYKIKLFMRFQKTVEYNLPLPLSCLQIFLMSIFGALMLVKIEKIYLEQGNCYERKNTDLHRCRLRT